MKASKLLLAGLFVAFAATIPASAQTAIYIAGAPATRKIWNIAIGNTLTAQSTGSPTITTYFSGSSFNSANQVIWTGGNIGGSPVTVYASWTGSTAANQSVAQNPSETNTSLKVAFLNLATSSSGGGNSDLSNLQYPHFALSDTFQATLPFHGHVTITSPATNYFSLNEAPTTNPAITGFKFVANKNSPARLNNITPGLAQQLFTGASALPLAFFTGAQADETIDVYPVGRDIGSGARYVLLAETGIGTANSSNLYQYTVNLSGSTISSYSASSGGTINLISFGAGGGGYSSFTPVLTALSATSNDSTGYFVTYVTDSDATTVISAGGHELSWNGYFYGTTFEGAHNTAPVSIAEGQYSFWSYLHVYYYQPTISASHPLSFTFAKAVAADLATDTATGAILSSDVQVSRAVDGGPISANYSYTSF